MPRIDLGSVPPWESGGRGQEFLRQQALTNPVGYRKGYMMQAFEEGDLWFPSVRKCFSRGANLAEWRQRGLPTYVGMDVAGDKRPGWAITTLGLDPNTHHRYLLDVRHWAGSAPQAIDQLHDAVSLCTNLKYIMIENNGVQQMIVDWIDKGLGNKPWWWTRVEGFTTGRNKSNEEYGLRTLEVEFHREAWVIPSNEFDGHQPGCPCSWCEWVRQMTLYPKGSATDLVMSSWFAREAIREWGGHVGLNLNIGDPNLR